MMVRQFVIVLNLILAACSGASARLLRKRGLQGIAHRPRIHFLFLTVDRMQRLDVWQRFFEGAPSGDHRIIWHCKDVAGCHAQLQAAGREEGELERLGNTPIEIIEHPAPTQYCTDLVSAENALLERALADVTPGGPAAAPAAAKSSFLEEAMGAEVGAGDRDKFVLLSDSTVPVKSFAEMYKVLTAQEDSRFCIFPRQEWAKAPREHCRDSDARCPSWAASGECDRNPFYMMNSCQKACKICADATVQEGAFPAGKSLIAAKTHQWKVLNRRDAAKSVALWRAGYLRHLNHMLHLNFRDSYRNTGCLDEYWHFAALYGTFPMECTGRANKDRQCNSWAARGECASNPNYMMRACDASCAKCEIPPTKFLNADPLELSFAGDAGVQGKCDTFVRWNIAGAMGREGVMGEVSELARADRELRTGGAEFKNSGYRPESLEALTVAGLRAFRKSSFLFARKFGPSFHIKDLCVPTADAMASNNFDQAVPQVSSYSWAGEGIWIDSEQRQVSVINDPSRQNAIVIQNGHDSQWSGWGTTCGESVAVTFVNKKVFNAQLDASTGTVLSWVHGVSWYRDLPWRGDGTWIDTANNTVLIRSWGGKFLHVTNSDPEWNAKGELEHQSGAALVAKFKKVMDGKQVSLRGWLSPDYQRITWHNGHQWKRDKDFSPPCVCKPDGQFWARPTPSLVPQCFVMAFGGFGDVQAMMASINNRSYDVGSFVPQSCSVVLADTNPEGSQVLSSLAKSNPKLTALPMTAGYSCEPASKKASVSSAPSSTGALRPLASGASAPVNVANIMRVLKERTHTTDHVVLRLDLGGSEWDLVPCLARSSAARHIDRLYIRKLGTTPHRGSFGTSKEEAEQALFRLKQMGIQLFYF